VTALRVLGVLGEAARSARRVGLGRPTNALVDAADGLVLRLGAPLLKVSLGEVELRGYLRHRGFLEYVRREMPEESYYRSLVLAAVDSETTFVDAGAHIGVYTLLTCGRARRVLAFEPDPYKFAALRCNVERAGCANVDIRPEAIAERAGAAEFRAFRSTFSGSLVPREIETYRAVDVKTIALDDVLDDSDLARLVVKLDVEGAEPLALAGMSASIRRAGSVSIFAEVNPEALEAGGSSAKRLVEDLHAGGIECSWVDEDRGTLVPVPRVGRIEKGNLACVKRSAE
jgi:FkbM family methyltransferase